MSQKGPQKGPRKAARNVLTEQLRNQLAGISTRGVAIVANTGATDGQQAIDNSALDDDFDDWASASVTINIRESPR